MLLTNPIELTIWLVGADEDDALGSMPFDSPDSATSFMADNPGMKMYSATAYIDPTSIQEES